MSTFESSADLFSGGILTGLIYVALTAGAAAQHEASPPDFSSNNVGWLTFNVDFSIVPGANEFLCATTPPIRGSAIRRLPEPASSRPTSSPIWRAPPFSSPGSWSG